MADVSEAFEVAPGVAIGAFLRCDRGAALTDHHTLFLLQSPVREALLASGQTRLVVSLFLTGVTAQIVVAFLNKYANWYCYYGEDNPDFLRTGLYQFWARIASQFWIDIILDVLTVSCFLAAIWMLFDIFAR